MLLDQHLLPGGGPVIVALQHRSSGRRDERLLRFLILVLLLEEDLRDDDVAGAQRLAGRFPRFGLGRWRGRAVLQPGRKLRRAARAGTGYGRRARFGRSSTKGGKLNFQYHWIRLGISSKLTPSFRPFSRAAAAEYCFR